MTPALKPWQTALLDKLLGPVNHREIIFVVDERGAAGKTHFCVSFPQEHGRSYTMRSFKPNDLIDYIIENGEPDVVFLDDVSHRKKLPYDFLEKLKDGKVVSYNSKHIPLHKIPHVVVMTNSLPRKSIKNDEGLSDDRYIYLYLKEDNDFEWIHGYRDI